MDFVNMLSRTFHGQVKPMVTQCTIRHLYNLQTASNTQAAPDQDNKSTLTQAGKTAILDLARTCEKRRCGHHDLENPLSTLECLKSIIDPKSSSTNRHRYVLACQDESVRRWARSVRGTPSVYVKRSVMIMEPMAEISASVKESAEREKLRSGIKRKRGETKGQVQSGESAAPVQASIDERSVEKEEKKKKARGPKEPNPLSVKKARPKPKSNAATDTINGNSEIDQLARKKRKRRHGGTSEATQNVEAMQVTEND